MFEKQGGFANFWHYNKIKIISLILLIAFAIFGLSQCSYGTEVDFGILHVSEVSGVSGDAFVEALKRDALISSANWEPNVEFISVYVPSDPKLLPETGALEKIQIELINGNSTLFILDEETVYSYKDEDLFYDLTDIADKYDVPDEARYLGPNGEVIGISADGNAYLDACSLESDSLYMAIRDHSADDAEQYVNAFSALEYIISNR